MFENASIPHALASAYVTLLGFPSAPDWHRVLNSTFLGRMLSLTLFIYQGGGRQDLLFSFVVAAIFYIFVSITKYIHITLKTANEEYSNFTQNLSDSLSVLVSTN
jgi:uncharacterized membrane protein YjjP (DUF1212 family)